MGFTKKVITTGLVLGGTIGTLALINAVTETMAGELDTVLTGEERRYPWKYGDMFYKVKGARESKPLVLIHSFAPGASSYEWRRNIDALSEQFRVYAIDLLGFGLSDHPAIDYDGELYTDLLSDFIREVVGKPAVVVAHGLPSAYVVAVAYRRPQLFERVVLVAPPTSIVQEVYPGALNTVQRAALRLPVIGQFVYNILTTRQAIRGYYDAQGFHNPGLITDELVEYIYTSAHQPDSRYAPASFLSGELNLDIHEALARLQVPLTAVWGRESSSSPYEASAAFKRVNMQTEVHIIDKAAAQLQDEQAAQFNNVLRTYAGAPAQS
jgi:pimeloyl-ACP methyl ester carboxylesterase